MTCFASYIGSNSWKHIHEMLHVMWSRRDICGVKCWENFHLFISVFCILLFDCQTIFMLLNVGWIWYHMWSCAYNFKWFLLSFWYKMVQCIKSASCMCGDTPVMTYFTSYIVPIPESTSTGWCTLCGAEGTPEEFSLLLLLLNVWINLSILSVVVG